MSKQVYGSARSLLLSALNLAVAAALVLMACGENGTNPTGGTKQFTVSFNPDGGTPSFFEPVTVDSGKSIGAANFPDDPVKDGKFFGGWFDGNVKYTATTPITKNMTLKAVWLEAPQAQKKLFVVAFDSDGGTPFIAPIQVDSGQTMEALPSEPRKPDFIFDGWFDGNTKYTASTRIAKSVILTAKWTVDGGATPPAEQKRCLVAFDTDGGFPELIVPAIIDSGNTIGNGFPADPVKEKNAFQGWYDGTTDTKYASSTKITKSVMLTARWLADQSVTGPVIPPKKQFFVAFDPNGGTPSFITPVTVDSGASLGTKFPANPARPNNKFDGWFDGNVLYTAASVIVKNVTLTAKWTDTTTTQPAKQFLVSFNPDGGTPASVTPVMVDSGKTLGTNFPANPTKAGNFFEGWFDGEIKYTPTTVIVKAVTLKAVWTDTTTTVVPPTGTYYTVSFNSDGGVPALIQSIYVDRGKPAEDKFPTVKPAKLGYIFIGWFNGSTQYTANTAITNDVTLTAKWEAIEEYETVFVAGGTYTRGCTPEQTGCASDERPAQDVTITAGFRIGKYHVTQKLWNQIMGSNSSDFKGDDLPVTGVSWNEVAGPNGFIERIKEMTGKTYRLPTEAEWEYAARGGASSKRYMYAGSNTIGDVAWYYGNSGPNRTIHPVGTKAPNELGIYDMSGNAWEWVNDIYSSSAYTSTPVTDPTGPTSTSSNPYRVIRGGSYDHDATYCRVSSRNSESQSNRPSRTGFRLIHVP